MGKHQALGLGRMGQVKGQYLQKEEECCSQKKASMVGGPSLHLA